MIRKSLRNQTYPLTPTELKLCQRAFDAFLVERSAARDSEEAEVAAALIIELYQKGIRDEKQLLLLAKAADGRA
ncbi:MULTISPECIES: hypothetical protein [unclassified Rhizobium]|uniref:hypothetical protein n=1 Tax=unclassified Rhizobium TaxID=2613769 RepID=UPI000EA9EBDA|nr:MULTISPECIES: hypothetical protein [unclassified Rhizobium]AYG69881.1 hypothetical protein CCGE531_27765 [Rhizobium sp. CCGE531]AYG76261.1 hypothetical protein CCGE532_27255 [Rhizobium sp. CCGE532]